MENFWFLYVILYTYVVWRVFKRDFEYEAEIARTGVVMDKHKGRVTTESPIGLIGGIGFVSLLICPLIGISAAMMAFAEFLLQYFIAITICHILLLIALPILRDYISARACSYMWIMPAIFSLFIRITRRYVEEPFVTVKIPETYVKIAFWVWIVGFIAVMTYKTLSHLKFRKTILEDARNVTDLRILDLWEKEQTLIERRKPIPLLVSDKVASPMTIGVFDSKLRAVLPHTLYNEEELQLIFRHELRHIQRQDNKMKMFLTECQAFCWFNPLMWIAAEKAAQDIELSCDEMVLYSANEEKRRKYAKLLLDTAGDSRGYTTCLSASARTLRYRLKNIMNVRKKFPGAEVVAGMMALLLLTNSAIAVSINQETTGEIIFKSLEKEEKQPVKAYISSVSFKNQSGYRHNSVYAWNEKELLDYVKSIKTTRIDPTEKFVSSRYEIAVHVQTGECLLRIKISDKMIEVTTYQNSDYAGLYKIEQEIDWTYLRSLLNFDAKKEENPDPPPVRPTLSMFFDPPLEPYEEALYAQECIISIDRDGEKEEFELKIEGWGGLHGIKVDKAFLEFNYEPESFHIEIEGMNGEGKETVNPSQLGEGNALDLKPYYARYTVYGIFKSHRNTTYEMAFWFEINPNEK